MIFNVEEIMGKGRIIQQEDLISNSKKYNKSWDALFFNDELIIRKTAFFCHSHKDSNLVLGLRTVFEQKGIDLYVDWTDQTMPKSPNKETALKLQKKIAETDVFFYLVTENSMKSTWCPWEIGYADAVKQNIYVIPTSDGDQNYGNEYLELYKTIQSIGFSNYLIKYPDSRESTLLNESSFWGE